MQRNSRNTELASNTHGWKSTAMCYLQLGGALHNVHRITLETRNTTISERISQASGGGELFGDSNGVCARNQWTKKYRHQNYLTAKRISTPCFCVRLAALYKYSIIDWFCRGAYCFAGVYTYTVGLQEMYKNLKRLTCPINAIMQLYSRKSSLHS